MSEVVLVGLGYFLTIVGFGLFFLQAKRTKEAETQLVAKATLHADQEKQAVQLQKENKALKEKVSAAESAVLELDQTVKKLQSRVEQSTTKRNKKLEELEANFRNVEVERDNFKEQAHALTAQLKEIDAEKRELRLQAKDASEVASSKVRAELDKLKAKNRDLLSDVKEKSAELNKVERKFSRLKEDSQKIEPTELKKMKRKLVQYSHFYMTMKGLKELAEERNDNWQTALKHLSRFIVNKEAPDFAATKPEIGPLVAKALTITGNDFGIQDDEPESPQTKTEKTPTKSISEDFKRAAQESEAASPS